MWFSPSVLRLRSDNLEIVYIANAVESLNQIIRKSIKTRCSFPTDEAATKLIYLAIRSFEKDGRNVQEWFAAVSSPP